MKILIVGSEGFFGKKCQEYFSGKGHEVFCCDVQKSTASSYWQLAPTDTNFNVVFENQRYDVCINASGSAHVGFSFENPSIDFELNVLNVQKLLVAIRTFNPQCKFLNFSSAAVYGNPASLPILESHAKKPISPYGFHKLQSELLLTEYHNFFQLKTCSLRVFSAFGPGLKKQLFWDLFQKVSKQTEISLFGTGKESRDFIYIDDLVRLIDLIIENADFVGENYNVANGTEIPIEVAVKNFIKEYGKDVALQFSGEVKSGDPLHWRSDISKIKALGYSPMVSFEEGIRSYVQWIKNLK